MGPADAVVFGGRQKSETAFLLFPGLESKGWGVLLSLHTGHSLSPHWVIRGDQDEIKENSALI